MSQEGREHNLHIGRLMRARKVSDNTTEGVAWRGPNGVCFGNSAEQGATQVVPCREKWLCAMELRVVRLVVMVERKVWEVVEGKKLECQKGEETVEF